jgi:urease accessory protein
MADCSFSSPLKIAKPFYRDNGYTELMIMCASPGMLSGDRFDMQFDLGPNTKTIISTQSYQKLYDTGDETARQNVQIRAGENAELFYCPHPVIPFAKNKFHSKVEIALRPSSRLIFGDILTCGRYGMGERFAFSEYQSRTLISIDGRPAFLDAVRLVPNEAELGDIGFFEGFNCQGLLYLYGYEHISLPEFPHLEAALTKAHEGYTVRILSDDAAAIYQFSKDLFMRTLTIS